jgi:hypothetical protein
MASASPRHTLSATESMTQLAGRLRWLRQNGPTTFEVRLDVPVPDPAQTALTLGLVRTL